MTERARFQGRNRNGIPVTGVAKPGESAADLAYRLYRNGYQRASIFVGTRRAGGVDHDGRRRIWWGESDEHVERREEQIKRVRRTLAPAAFGIPDERGFVLMAERIVDVLAQPPVVLGGEGDRRMSDRDEQVETVWRALIANASVGEGITRRLAEWIVDALAQPVEFAPESREATQAKETR